MVHNGQHVFPLLLGPREKYPHVQNVIYNICSNSLKHKIIEIVEMDYIKKVAISLLNKTIQIWNLAKQKLLLTIEQLSGNMHNLVFNEQYQVLLCSGFQKDVLLFQIDYRNQVSCFYKRSLMRLASWWAIRP